MVVAVEHVEAVLLRHVGSLAARTFHDKLHDTIAVEVAQRDVVECVVGGHIGAVATRYLLYGDGEHAVIPSCDDIAFRLLYATDYSSHLILAGGCSAGVSIVRSREVLGNLCAVAV